MKKIEKTENQVVFTAEISDTLANSIRRYINQIPVLAVDEVEISRNDSPLYDETVAHRIGLVPLKADKSANVEKTSGKLKLEVKKEGIVYSGEIKGQPAVVYKSVPITALAKNQELQLTATVKAGKGFEHAKFSPGIMFYRNVSEITLDKEFYDEIKEIVPEDRIKEKGNKITIVDNKKKDVADVVEGICNRRGKKAEIEEKDELVITLESFGQMDVEDILKKSVQILKKDLNEVSKQVGKA